jgi:SRSO17 transposase
VDTITFPLTFHIFKPRKRLKPTDVYRTKPKLATELIQELVQQRFQIDLVLADGLYGESTEFVEGLLRLQLRFVVALHRNHGVWLGPGERIHYTRWRVFERVFTNGISQTRYLREVIYGKRRNLR